MFKGSHFRADVLLRTRAPQCQNPLSPFASTTYETRLAKAFVSTTYKKGGYPDYC